jgi:hypothetical protein
MSDTFNVLGGTLQRHAYENVWCTPSQDKQMILQLARLTPDRGVWVTVTIQWRRYALPDKLSRFHIYQVGQVWPSLLGLTESAGVWVNVAQSCKQNSCIADFYSAKGVQIPRGQAWYMVTQDKNLVFAVRIPDATRLPFDLDTEALNLRLYTNAFYESTRANDAQDIVDVHGVIPQSTQDILDFQDQLLARRALGHGHTYCFLNGFKVEDINLTNATIGDYLEYVYDGSIRAVVSWDLNSLVEFHSDLDNVHKYLLHHALTVTTIDFHDDVDLFLVKKSAGNHQGIYYHKNDVSAIRMVTHRDYSVPTQYLMSYAQQVAELGGNVEALTLIMHIRHSGYDRPLVYEHNMVQDLYRLSEADIVNAMVGVNATVDVWKAANLEKSGYCALMRAPIGTISLKNVQEAYGYNAVSKILGDTPLRTRDFGGEPVTDIPVGLQNNCTVYEYDAQGRLRGWHAHSGNPLYVTQEANTDLVETLYGRAREGVHAWWDVDTHTIDLANNHRFYVCDKVAGVPNYEWVDVTDSDMYAVIGNTVTWVLDHDDYYTLVRSNRDHIAYNQDIVAIDGLIAFSLRELRSDISAYRTMTLPLGELDVFLNGYSLLENIDYFVEFPQIVITNKRYLQGDPSSDSQRVTVRFAGFCDEDLKRVSAPDVGFVQYGVLSYNNRYDLRDNKVNRIVLNGALYRYDEFEYGEDDFDVHVIDAKNGDPYAIRDILVPMNAYLFGSSPKQDPTFALREAAHVVDQQVTDYLTSKIPQKDPTPPSAIAAKYAVVSPFFNKIIHDLMSGALWDDHFTEQYNDNWVRQQCAPYEYLLAFDPVTEVRSLNPLFVAVHPHNRNHYLDLGAYQLKFLYRVRNLYGNNRIDLSAHVRVQAF